MVTSSGPPALFLALPLYLRDEVQQCSIPRFILQPAATAVLLLARRHQGEECRGGGGEGGERREDEGESKQVKRSKGHLRLWEWQSPYAPNDLQRSGYQVR